MSQTRNSHVAGNLQSSSHPGQFARKDLHEAGALKTEARPLHEVLKGQSLPMEQLIEQGRMVKSYATEAYVRNLVQGIGAKYPGVDRIYLNENRDPEYGVSYSLEGVEMIHPDMEVPEELRPPEIGNLDNFEVNDQAMYDHVSHDEDDSDYQRPFLNVSDWMDQGNEEVRGISSYAGQLEAMVRQAQEQIAVANLAISARRISDRFPEVRQFSMDRDPSNDLYDRIHRVSTVTMNDGTVAVREYYDVDAENTHEGKIDWDALDSTTPGSEVVEPLAGRNLSVNELIGWHPGDPIS